MLEVQCHNTYTQQVLNKHIMQLYRELGIPIIFGADSHYIYPEDKKTREDRLAANNIFYEDEEGWYMDYPSEEVVHQRFAVQGVLSRNHVNEALENTNIFLSFEDVEFDKGKKLPTVYPQLSQEERNRKYEDLIWAQWNERKKDIPEDRWPEYEEGIRYEVNTVTSTNTSDYFLLDYEIVKRFKELGGHLTFTGRGSAPSYYTNNLLGFSSIDRFALPVTLYPDRFISADRLKAGSLPDIDMNVSEQDIFAKAQAEIMGDWHSAPMIAFGTLKRSSAWKMYCRAANIPFQMANEVSDMISKYELAKKYADEDDTINIEDFIPETFRPQLKESEKYLGIIDSLSPHPCAYVITNNDIRREFGIIKMKNRVTGKEVLAAMIDGATADAYGYLKNDNLKVDVVGVNAAIYDRIGIKQPTVNELCKMIDNDQATWSMYANGYTMGLNQVEKDKTREKVMVYKPRNVSEASAFVAGIRPGFKSMAPLMFNRQRFSYNIPALDKLLVTSEMPDSFILYQEQVMAILQWAGFAASQSYAAIKAIAKKHPEKVLPLKAQFMEGFKTRLMNESGLSEEEAIANTATVWQVVEDNTSYSFNASHSISVALDSLYTAWAKAHYPYETYAALLSNYAAKGDKKRIELAKAEMKKAFGIRSAPCKFRQDNREFYIDKDNKAISDTLQSMKGIGAKVAEDLYLLRDNKYETFTDLLYDLMMKTSLNSAAIDKLIQADYFIEFGQSGKLLLTYRNFTGSKNKITKTLKEATVTKRMTALREEEKQQEDFSIPLIEKLKFEVEVFGSPHSVDESRKGCYMLLEADTKFSPKLTLYNMTTGTTGRVKMKKADWNENPLCIGDIIHIKGFDRRYPYQYVNGKPMQNTNAEKEIWLTSYEQVYT